MYSTLSFLYVIFIPILASVLLLLNYILSKKSKNPEFDKLSTYESGFDAQKSMIGAPFNVGYYQVIIAFLLFDVDLCLFFPFVSLAGTSVITSVEIFVAIISTLIFFIGLIYDLSNGLADYAQPNKIKNFSSKFSPLQGKFSSKFSPHQGKLLQKRGYSTKANSVAKLDPWWVTGFSDAGCSFQIRFSERKRSLFNWRVSLEFEVKLPNKYLDLLKTITSFFWWFNLWRQRHCTTSYACFNAL